MKHAWTSLLMGIFLMASGCSSIARSGSTVEPLKTVVSASPASNVNSLATNPGTSAVLSPPGSNHAKPINTDLKEASSPLYFINEKAGWALVRGSLYNTKDGGTTWTKLTGPLLKNLKAVIFVSEQEGLAIRDDWNGKKRSNTVLRTENSGQSWREVLELPTPIYGINFVGPRVGYVSSRWYPIQETSDGGNTWKKIEGIEGLNYLYFIDRYEGWGYGGAIWHTDDGAKTWRQVISYEQVSDLWAVRFIDRSTGWIMGGKELWFTTDGKTWQKAMQIPRTEGLYVSMDFVNSQEGWIACEDGSVIHTLDGGSTWQVIAHARIKFSCIRFNNQTSGWALDTNGEFFRSTNGGATWDVVSLSH